MQYRLNTAAVQIVSTSVCVYLIIHLLISAWCKWTPLRTCYELMSQIQPGTSVAFFTASSHITAVLNFQHQVYYLLNQYLSKKTTIRHRRLCTQNKSGFTCMPGQFPVQPTVRLVGKVVQWLAQLLYEVTMMNWLTVFDFIEISMITIRYTFS